MPESSYQPSLFPDLYPDEQLVDDTSKPIFDIDKISQKIAAAAAKRPLPEDPRQSDAVRDQGHGVWPRPTFMSDIEIEQL